MGGIGGPELFIIFLVVLLVFGPRKIPEVARGLGKGLREIRRLTTEFQREINLSDAEDDRRRIGGDRPPPGPPRGTGAPRGTGSATAAPEPPAAETSAPAPAEREESAPPDGDAGDERGAK